MKKISLLAALAFASSTFALAAPSLVGTWSIHSNVEGNESDASCTFKLNDKAITGTCTSAGQEAPVTGTLEDGKVTWKYTIDYQGSPVALTYTAKLGDKMTGIVDVQPFGVTGDFSATPVTQDKK
jgi:hypothetical protein